MPDEEAASKADNEEVYYIRQPNPKGLRERDIGQWKLASKIDYAKFEGPSAASTRDEILEKIAEIEELPVSCLVKEGWGDDEGKTIKIVVGPMENLPSIMEWAKRTGEYAEPNYYGLNLRNIERNSPVPVHRPTMERNCNKFALGNEFVIDRNGLRYDPTAAADVIEMHKKNLTENPPQVVRRSKIVVNGKSGLQEMFRIVVGKIDKNKVLEQYYPGRCSWASNRLIRISYPSSREQHTWAIPRIAKFCITFTGGARYRTAAWKKCVKVLSTKLDDPAMTAEFAAFVKREMRFCR